MSLQLQRLCLFLPARKKVYKYIKAEVARDPTTASFVQVQTGTLVTCHPHFIIISNDEMPQAQIYPEAVGNNSTVPMAALFCNLDRSQMFGGKSVEMCTYLTLFKKSFKTKKYMEIKG